MMTEKDFSYLKQDIYKPAIRSADELLNKPTTHLRMSDDGVVKEISKLYGIEKPEAEYIVKNIKRQ